MLKNWQLWFAESSAEVFADLFSDVLVGFGASFPESSWGFYFARPNVSYK